MASGSWQPMRANHSTFFCSFTIMLFSLLIAPLLFTSVLAAPAAREGSCDLSKARLTLSGPENALAPPSTAPSFVSVAIGVQNYTCNATSKEYVSIGAEAEMFDISCLYDKPEFGTIQDRLYEKWLNGSDFTTIHKVIKQLGASPHVLGQHYFVKDHRDHHHHHHHHKKIVPKWDFTSASFKGDKEAYIIGEKVGNVSVNKTHVDWLSLKSVKGHLADTVYRVDTRWGQPPASQCVVGSQLQVKYTAKYWFFGGSVKDVKKHK
jgi:hypothetical protein